MRVHSLIMNGPFLIEQINKRGIWSDTDTGRIVYEKETDTYLLGGNANWISFSLLDTLITIPNFKLGFGPNELSAEQIPCEFNGSNLNLQHAINLLISGDINDDGVISDNSIISESLAITANVLKTTLDDPFGDRLLELVSEGDINLYCDSTSFLDLTIHDALIVNETAIYNVRSDNLPANDLTSTVQSEFDLLFASDPNPGNIQELRDFHGWTNDSTSVVEFHLSTTGYETEWNFVKSEKLLLNALVPSVIPSEYLNFQQYVDSCGADFKICKPYIISDKLIINDIIDYNILKEYYFRNHQPVELDLLYDFRTREVFYFYNGQWLLSDPECNVVEELTNNRIYSIPITNTMFYLDCDGIPFKIFDPKRLI